MFTNFDGTSNEKQTAERVIQHLTQRTSAADYAARFQEYANLIEWNDAALITMFRRDLKNNLKNKIIYNKRSINNMFDLIEVVIDLDNKLYKKAIKKRYN